MDEGEVPIHLKSCIIFSTVSVWAKETVERRSHPASKLNFMK
jgi:hypothetical protein